LLQKGDSGLLSADFPAKISSNCPDIPHRKGRYAYSVYLGEYNMNVSLARLRFGSSLIALAGVGLLGAAPAMAQDQAQAPAAAPSAAPSAAPAPSSEQPQMEEIIVTGSHLARTNLEQQVPVVAISTAQLQATGITNLADSLNKLPQFGVAGLSNVSTNFSDDGAGVSTINLRNLGDQRTLVLIDGRRSVSGVTIGQNAGAAVDVNTIPTFLVDSVDIVTGGAGAAYGSEAVAGVVNIKLRDHFEGLMLNQQFGLTTNQGDNQTETFDLLTGTSFADDKGHFVFGLEFRNESGILSKDREFAAHDISATSTLPGNYGPSSYILAGNFGVNGGLLSMNRNGVGFHPYDMLTDGYDRNQVRTILIPNQRISLYEKTNYEITDDIKFHIDGRYTHSDASSQLEPIAIGGLGGTPIGFAGNALVLPLSNPYFPAAMLSQVTAADKQGQYWLADWRRRLAELGNRGVDATRDTFAINTGFSGTIADRFTWHADYTYSEMDNFQEGIGGNVVRLQQELYAHKNAAGQIVCNNAGAVAAGCVPIDLFGAGTASAAAINYIKFNKTNNDQNAENDLNLDIGGPVYTLPWSGGGDVGLSAGFEYRTEFSYGRPDPITSQGFSLDTAQPPSQGFYSVEDYWIETKVPVLQDVPYAKSLTLNGSFRYSDYSNTNVGGKESYAYGLTYAPVQDIMFRAVNEVAIRAPDLNDLYAGRGNSAVSVNDPCAAAQVAGATNKAARIANCLTIPGMAARMGPNPGSASNPNGQFVESINNQQTELSYIQGNPGLTNERAQVLTYGVVLQPRWIPNFTATVDFFKYKIANAIQEIDQQTAANQCADTLASNFCDEVRRYASGPNIGLIQGVDQEPINVGSLDERGIDVQLNYNFGLEDLFDGVEGRISTQWNYTFLQQLEYTTINGATTNQRGLFGAPKNKWQLATTYSNDTIDLTWTLRYEGSQSYDGGQGGPTFSPFVYNDINFRYHLTDQITPYIGINNIFNVQPPLVFQQYQQTGGGVTSAVTGTNTVPDVYDVIGRFIYFGVKYQMDWAEAPAEAAPYVPPPVQAPAPAPKSYLVFFDFNKSDLTPQAVTIVDTAARNAQAGKVTELTVTGHTDTVGSDAYNMRLSRRRAESVAAELEKDGIASSEIQIVAKGKRDLLVPTGDGVREPQNRRVQIVFDGGPTS
jgi:outer membrane protein OmpA-like peptidoglycan-associated protein